MRKKNIHTYTQRESKRKVLKLLWSCLYEEEKKERQKRGKKCLEIVMEYEEEKNERQTDRKRGKEMF